MDMNLVEFRANMAEAVSRVAFSGERVVLTRHGKPSAVLVSVEEAALLDQLETATDLKAARKARREPGHVTLDDLKSQLGL